MKYPSYRQSEGWENFLSTLGWKTVKTSKGNKLFFLKSFIGNVNKTQRPNYLDKKELLEIDDIAKEYKSAFLKLELLYGQDETLVKEAGYKKTQFPLSPPKTLLINLSKSENALWKDISKTGRNLINRAKKEGSRVEIIKSPTMENVERFYKTYKFTGKRAKFYVEPKDQVHSLVNSFSHNSYLAWVFTKDNKLEGAKLFIEHKGVVTYMRGGSTPAGRQNYGGHLLMWESFLHFKNLGFRLIDLEGIDDDRFPRFTREWGGFSFFKEKFGGISVEFPYPYLKVFHPGLKFVSKLMPLPF